MSHNPLTQNVSRSIWENYSPPPQGAAIYSIKGDMTDANRIVISGSGFGQGANNHIYENFDGFNTNLQLLSEVPNNYDQVSTNARSSVGGKRTGSYCLHGQEMDALGERIGGAATCIKSLGRTTEIFVSHSLKNPLGASMPWVSVDNGANVYSSDSSVKPVWLLNNLDGGDGSNGAGNDLVLFMLNANRWNISGNALTNYVSTFDELAPSSWQFDEWVRLTSWLSTKGADPLNTNTTSYFQMMNRLTGQTVETRDNVSVFASGGTAPYQWSHVNVPAWDRDGSTARLLFDEVYIAWGGNEAARVEIGDNANYGLCSKLSICDHVSWEDNQIVVNLRESDLDLTGDVFLFITGVDNTQLVARQVL